MNESIIQEKLRSGWSWSRWNLIIWFELVLFGIKKEKTWHVL